jgi:hypothetical protein
MVITKKNINIIDNNVIDDQVFIGNNNPIGRVKVYARKVGSSELYLLHNTSNLVVYHGRSWLIQRAFNKNAVSESGVKDKYICWFAVGTGAALPGSPLTVSSPTLKDIGLSSHGVIQSGVNYVTVGGKQYHKFDTGYPTFIDDEEIPLLDVSVSTDRKVVAQVTTTLTADEANNDGGVVDPTAFQNINEAGLYISDANTVSPAPTTMDLFARVTFPTTKKNYEYELVINWYLFF